MNPAPGYCSIMRGIWTGAVGEGKQIVENKNTPSWAIYADFMTGGRCPAFVHCIHDCVKLIPDRGL